MALVASSVASLPSLFPSISRHEGLQSAGWVLSLALMKGRQIDARLLRTTMEEVFKASDAEGAWGWKDAYEAVELAQVYYLRRHAASYLGRMGNPHEILADLQGIQLLTPSQTRRSEDQVAFQQFSTPIDLAFVASMALAARSSDIVLEPSAGTGMLAIFAEMAGARVYLNELDPKRAEILSGAFRDTPVTRHNAEQINDRLDQAIRPNLVLMNPPFSVSPNVTGKSLGADFRHIASALARLSDGGRLVAITGASLSPEVHGDKFAALQRRGGRLAFSMPIDGKIYARHGTSTDTRLTIIDKVACEDTNLVKPSEGMAGDLASLLEAVLGAPRRAASTPVVPVRHSFSPSSLRPTTTRQVARSQVHVPAAAFSDVVSVEYTISESRADTTTPSAGIYETYKVATIEIAGAASHPTPLVESAAMSAVRLPAPTYQPRLPRSVIENGLLSEAQLETIIYAGEAHSSMLDGHWIVGDSFDTVHAAPDGAEGAVAFRKGFFVGDGTGVGKGRQIAGALLDNWLQGRRRLVWVSKNDTLLEDAQRDWVALGGRKEQVVPLSRFVQGAKIGLDEAILFVTYGTLRTGAKAGKISRLDQIVEWFGRDGDGLIAFDEAHAMANAAGEKGARGDRKPSEQGIAGLRIQNALPNARILYVSATGATTVANLGYATRLGLWGSSDFPFPTRASFVCAMEAGGVAAMEVMARDLKALGLYTARSLSYAGVEYEMLVHDLTADQVEIYDAYAGAFKIIHNNLEDALKATGICSQEGATQNANAKGAARSAFESVKQRFFAHLLSAMKVPSVITAIDEGLAAGMAPVIQLVSTGEALTSRRLENIPVAEWNDIQVDVTPREYVMDYLIHSFPTTLFEEYSDEDGNIRSRPVYEDGQPLVCQEAMAQRDALVESLGALPPVQAALDQLIQHYGADKISEVTGRSRRIVRKDDAYGSRLCVESRPASSNRGETQAFMDGKKEILVFSDAGGTGRSYHADLGAKNQKRRLHLLLEPGWNASSAVQGLGRTNRTNQAQPPLFRPVATNVKGEKRFLSTIARRLDSLGAITKGQRQTGGQGLFRAEDNLESDYAKTALRRLFQMLHAGTVEGLSLGEFEEATGLELCDADGTLKESLPPITRTLNRLLALPIAMQDRLFGYLEERIEAEVDAAVASGQFEIGVETLQAERFTVTNRQTIFTHEGSGAVTRLLTIEQVQRVDPVTLDEALEIGHDFFSVMMVNRTSGRAAVATKAASRMTEDGKLHPRVRLIRPMSRETMSLEEQQASHWEPADRDAFAAAWKAELDDLPETITSEFHVVTGLLLPIWSRLPQEATRVYRLEADGERIIGRVVRPEEYGAMSRQFGLERPKVSVADAWSLVLNSGGEIQLADGVSVRRSLVAGVQRVEVQNYPHTALGQLKAIGLTTEIINYKTRLFISANDTGPTLLEAVMKRHPFVDARRRQGRGA